MAEYKVEGYGERTAYDGPYHPDADFDPKFVFAHAGSPKKQAKYQQDLIKLGEDSKPVTETDPNAGKNVSTVDPATKQAPDAGEVKK